MSADTIVLQNIQFECPSFAKLEGASPCSFEQYIYFQKNNCRYKRIMLCPEEVLECFMANKPTRNGHTIRAIVSFGKKYLLDPSSTFVYCPESFYQIGYYINGNIEYI